MLEAVLEVERETEHVALCTCGESKQRHEREEDWKLARHNIEFVREPVPALRRRCLGITTSAKTRTDGVERKVSAAASLKNFKKEKIHTKIYTIGSTAINSGRHRVSVDPESIFSF